MQSEWSAQQLDELSIQYSQKRPKFTEFCNEVSRILEILLRKQNVNFQVIDKRAKGIKSFIEKCCNVNDKGELKYNDPIKQITDLSGVRIICYTRSIVEHIENIIESSFQIIEKTDVGEKRYEEGQFGYQSVHYLIQLEEERQKLPEYAHFKGLTCEIQVRTILQHAWAEIEHGIRYKSKTDLPISIKKEFTALAGLMEIADKEFQRIQDYDSEYKRRLSEKIDDVIIRDAMSKPKSTLPNKTNEQNHKVDTTQPFRVKDLMAQSQYEDALRAYDELIKAQPKNYTLFLGRAKARILTGDRSGALQDVNTGETLKGSPGIFEHLREQIEQDTIQAPKPKIYLSNFINKGDEALITGDAIQAFEHYSIAQEEGYSRPYSIFNKAMACCLGGDYDGVNQYLNSLEFRPGTSFSINTLALRCIAARLDNLDSFDTYMQELEQSIEDSAGFKLEISPLVKLSKGLEIDNTDNYKAVAHIFNAFN